MLTITFLALCNCSAKGCHTYKHLEYYSRILEGTQ